MTCTVGHSAAVYWTYMAMCNLIFFTSQAVMWHGFVISLASYVIWWFTDGLVFSGVFSCLTTALFSFWLLHSVLYDRLYSSFFRCCSSCRPIVTVLLLFFCVCILCIICFLSVCCCLLSVTCWRMKIYRVGQKMAQFMLNTLTLSTINRFSKFFHCQNQEKICNNIITKDPTTP